METKKCKICLEEKSIDLFYLKKDFRSGKSYYFRSCKSCLGSKKPLPILRSRIQVLEEGNLKWNCKKCAKLKEASDYGRFFSKAVNKWYFKRTCKECCGVKKSRGLHWVLEPTPDEKPKREEIIQFITEMEFKDGWFSMVDSYRLVDIFTREYGILYSGMDAKEELKFMWKTLKEDQKITN